MAANGWTFDPNSLYGGTQDQSSTPIVSGPNGFLANNEDAAYYRFIAPFAQGQDSFSNYVRSQMSNVLRNFRAAQATNPNLQLPDFLQGFDQNTFMNQYLNSGMPSQRGETSPSQLGAGRLKWYQGSR
jgi:hypothetical protein